MQFLPTQHKNRRILAFILCGLVLAGGLLIVLEKSHIIDLYHKKPGANLPKTTSTAKTAQETFSQGNPRDAGNTLNESKGSAAVTDGGGSASSSVDTSNPIVSKTGEITIYSPQNNELVKSGLTVSGLSKLSSVSYRVIDNVSGVISTGDLSVVNGKFSGTLSFSTGADSGRIDFFGTKFDGTEYSNVEIPVRFK